LTPRKKSTETTTASVSSGFSSTPMSTASVGRMAIATIAARSAIGADSRPGREEPTSTIE
jgi:hypothetical protein